MKKSIKKLTLFIGLIASATIFAGEEDKVIYENSMDDLSGWKIEGPEITMTPEKKIIGQSSKGAMKLHLKVNNDNGKGWPQAVCKLPEIPLDSNIFIEFDYYYKPIKGDVRIGVAVLPLNTCKARALPTNLKAEEWHKIRFPLVPPSDTSKKIEGLCFYIGEKYNQTGDEAVFYIDNLRIISSPKMILSAETTLTDAKVLPIDKRLEIEIPNLLVNGYFREGGTQLPPRGWSTFGDDKISYAESRHDGQAIRLAGSDKNVILRQYGIILVPGEKYRLSGYIRGKNFKGNGGIGVICDNWSKFWGFKINNDVVRAGWHYFETTFTPGPSKSGDYHAVIYRQKGTGTLDVDRVILEPLTERGLKESKNKLMGNKFDENYAKAYKEGKLKEGPPSDDYKLVWSDEFDGTSIDQNKWKIYDLDRYKDARGYVLTPKSVVLNGKGQLMLTTRLVNGVVEQPRLATCDGKYETAYGYFECRLKMHKSDAVNAAFWMLPAGKMDARDPVNKGMEIDILECVLPKMGKLSHTTHWYSRIDGKLVSYSGGTVGRSVPGFSEGFHSVGFEWTPEEYVFYIDGIESWRLNKKDHPIAVNPHYMILTFGANMKKVRKIPDFSDTFEVDYVRVYKKKKEK